MTIQNLHDKGFFNKYNTGDDILKDYLVIERRRPDLVNTNSRILFTNTNCKIKQRQT